MTRQALIVVDIQNDYFPQGKWPLVGAEAAADNAAAAADNAADAAGEAATAAGEAVEAAGEAAVAAGLLERASLAGACTAADGASVPYSDAAALCVCASGVGAGAGWTYFNGAAPVSTGCGLTTAVCALPPSPG